MAATAFAQDPVQPPTVVETRFGTFEFDQSNTLFMPCGPLGFASQRHFGLANLPDPKLAAFKLLQSLENPEVSFILTPFELTPDLISAEDLESGAQSVGFDVKACNTMLIVTARSEPDGVKLSVNLRAPILMDLSRRLARQVVLGNADLPVRHAINGPQA
jgi:flagellar assembly factor FliW